MTASTDTFKVTESIGDRAGSYNFSPALIASRSRRKQRPLYSAHPMGITESPFFDRAGSEGCIKGWSPRMLQWRGITSQSTQPESKRANRVFVDAYDVNPISLHGRDDGVSRGPTR